MKKFFKSDWFKCTAVLLGLLIVLGGTLAVLNDVLFVSPEERTARAISKFYDTTPSYEVILDADAENGKREENQFGYIEKIFEIGDETLFKSTGINGYKGGTITLWLKVVKNEQGYKIDKIVLDGYEKQTLMSKFDAKYFRTFTDVTFDYENKNSIFSPKNNGEGLTAPMTGATYSANAACNAVNCVLAYLGGME